MPNVSIRGNLIAWSDFTDEFQYRIDAAGGNNYGAWESPEQQQFRTNGNSADAGNVDFSVGDRVQFRDGDSGDIFPDPGYVIQSGSNVELNGESSGTISLGMPVLTFFGLQTNFNIASDADDRFIVGNALQNIQRFFSQGAANNFTMNFERAFDSNFSPTLGFRIRPADGGDGVGFALIPNRSAGQYQVADLSTISDLETFFDNLSTTTAYVLDWDLYGIPAGPTRPLRDGAATFASGAGAISATGESLTVFRDGAARFASGAGAVTATGEARESTRDVYLRFSGGVGGVIDAIGSFKINFLEPPRLVAPQNINSISPGLTVFIQPGAFTDFAGFPILQDFLYRWQEFGEIGSPPRVAWHNLSTAVVPTATDRILRIREAQEATRRFRVTITIVQEHSNPYNRARRAEQFVVSEPIDVTWEDRVLRNGSARFASGPGSIRAVGEANNPETGGPFNIGEPVELLSGQFWSSFSVDTPFIGSAGPNNAQRWLATLQFNRFSARVTLTPAGDASGTTQNNALDTSGDFGVRLVQRSDPTVTFGWLVGSQSGVAYTTTFTGDRAAELGAFMDAADESADFDLYWDKNGIPAIPGGEVDVALKFASGPGRITAVGQDITRIRNGAATFASGAGAINAAGESLTVVRDVSLRFASGRGRVTALGATLGIRSVLLRFRSGVGRITANGRVLFRIGEARFASGDGRIIAIGVNQTVVRSASARFSSGAGAIRAVGESLVTSRDGAARFASGAGTISVVGEAQTVVREAAVKFASGAGAITATGENNTVVRDNGRARFASGPGRVTANGRALFRLGAIRFASGGGTIAARGQSLIVGVNASLKFTSGPGEITATGDVIRIMRNGWTVFRSGHGAIRARGESKYSGEISGIRFNNLTGSIWQAIINRNIGLSQNFLSITINPSGPSNVAIGSTFLDGIDGDGWGFRLESETDPNATVGWELSGSDRDYLNTEPDTIFDAIEDGQTFTLRYDSTGIPERTTVPVNAALKFSSGFGRITAAGRLVPKQNTAVRFASGAGSIAAAGEALTVVRDVSLRFSSGAGAITAAGRAETVVRDDGEARFVSGAGAITATGEALTVIRQGAIRFASGAGAIRAQGRSVDRIAPVFERAEISEDGTVITLVFNENLSTNRRLPTSGNFNLVETLNGVSVTNSATVTAADNTVVLTFENPIPSGATIAGRYVRTATASGRQLRDNAGNRVATFNFSLIRPLQQRQGAATFSSGAGAITVTGEALTVQRNEVAIFRSGRGVITAVGESLTRERARSVTFRSGAGRITARGGVLARIGMATFRSGPGRINVRSNVIVPPPKSGATQTFRIAFLNVGTRFGLWSSRISGNPLSNDFFEADIPNSQFRNLRLRPTSIVIEFSQGIFNNPNDFSILLDDGVTDPVEIHPVPVSTTGRTNITFNIPDEDQDAYTTFYNRNVGTGLTVNVSLDVTISNEPRSPPVIIRDQSGTPTGRMGLMAPGVVVSDRTDANVGIFNISPPTIDLALTTDLPFADLVLLWPQIELDVQTSGEPRAQFVLRDPDEIRIQGEYIGSGVDDIFFRLKAAPLRIEPQSTGAALAIFDIRPEINNFPPIATGAPFARANLREPRISMTASSGAPTGSLDMDPSTVILPPFDLAATVFATMRIVAPVAIRDATGIPSARSRLTAPVGVDVDTGQPNARMDIADPGQYLGVSVSTGTPAASTWLIDPGTYIRPPSIRTGINRAEMRLAGPIRISASTQANIGRLQLILGFTEAQFRYLPNLTITRRQPVSFTIPKVSYPVPGGRYVVRGLPDGLTFDPETLEVSGTTDDVAQIYQIEVEYLEPGDG